MGAGFGHLPHVFNLENFPIFIKMSAHHLEPQNCPKIETFYHGSKGNPIPHHIGVVSFSRWLDLLMQNHKKWTANERPPNFQANLKSVKIKNLKWGRMENMKVCNFASWNVAFWESLGPSKGGRWFAPFGSSFQNQKLVHFPQKERLAKGGSKLS